VSDDLCRQPPQGLSAWSLTHKALTFWTVSYTREASADAIQWLEQALALEPGNAMAHVVLGFVLNQRVINSFAEDPPEENRRALAEVEAALRLAPRDATVIEYASLVWLNCGMRQKSLQTARRVVGIAPFNMIAWGYLGCGMAWGSWAEGPTHSSSPVRRRARAGKPGPTRISCTSPTFSTVARPARRATEARQASRNSASRFAGQGKTMRRAPSAVMT